MCVWLNDILKLASVKKKMKIYYFHARRRLCRLFSAVEFGDKNK